MININNKPWEKLRFSDILKLLSEDDDENFFFEFKEDNISTEKLVKEISALSNTYGGYIILGVSDDKKVLGCTKWTEQKIHTTIHDSLTPVPIFDVKRFKPKEGNIFVIKVEEGPLPPYITNKGNIFERVSSGSFKITTSDKLTQMYYKREDNIKRIEQKIYIEDLQQNENLPTNLCGYLDMGFSLTYMEQRSLQNKLFDYDFEKISNHLKSLYSDFSISKVGTSYLFTIGKSTQTVNNQQTLCTAGLHNFMEIMADGSMKMRIVIFSSSQEDYQANILPLITVCNEFKKIYSMIFGDSFIKKYIYAQKYEKLTVLKQFKPYYFSEGEKLTQFFNEYTNTHIKKYGNNIIVQGNRNPKNGFRLIDKRFFNNCNVKYNNANLYAHLFSISHVNLGYIDTPDLTALNSDNN